MSMEMTVQPLNLAAVVFNKAEMAAAIAAINDRYKGLVVTDKAEAKRDRAEVNKLLRQIDDARKDVKRQYEAPLRAFEADIKELVEPLKASAVAIDQQIRAIEAQEQAEKREALEMAFANLMGTLEPRYPFERVFDPKWLNASVTLKKAEAELAGAVAAADADYTAIMAMQTSNRPALMRKWLDGATLAEVMAYEAELNRQAMTFSIDGAETPETVAAELNATDPRNVYIPTENGVHVTGKPSLHKLAITCTDGQYSLVLDALDRLGCFFIELEE